MSGPASQHDALYASLPSCPHCSRDLLSSCLHDFFALSCRCGRRIQLPDRPRRPSRRALAALQDLLEALEEQFRDLMRQAESDRSPAQEPRAFGVDRQLQHLEAQLILLRALTQPPARSRRKALRHAS